MEDTEQEVNKELDAFIEQHTAQVSIVMGILRNTYKIDSAHLLRLMSVVIVKYLIKHGVEDFIAGKDVVIGYLAGFIDMMDIQKDAAKIKSWLKYTAGLN